ncbi:MAG TPA: site-2 protease family protein [Bryobacteraceae bacterium]
MARPTTTTQTLTPGPISGSFGMLRVWGVPIRLHFTFLLLLAFLLLTGFGGRSSTGYLLYVTGLFLSVLLHELGHAWVSSQYGIRTVEIVMFPIGGVSRLGRRARPGEELWIALAGPTVNLVLAVILYFVATSRNPILNLSSIDHPTDDNLATQLFLGNLALAGFNLLPAFPMDGGRVLRAVLSRFKSEAEATRIASLAGRMLAISLALYAMLSGQYLLVFAAFFVYLGAAQEAAAALGRSLTAGIPVRSAMVTEFHTLSHDSTIRDAVGLTLATSQHDFPVMHGDQVVGLLSRHGILRTLASEGADAYIASAVEHDFVTLPSDADLADSLPSMARVASCALVMDKDELIGLLTTQNLSEFLVLRRFGMDPADIR